MTYNQVHAKVHRVKKIVFVPYTTSSIPPDSEIRVCYDSVTALSSSVCQSLGLSVLSITVPLAPRHLLPLPERLHRLVHLTHDLYAQTLDSNGF